MKKRTAIGSILATIVILAACVLVSLPMIEKIKKQRDVNQEIVELQQEIDRMKNQKSDLSQVIEYLKTDQYIKDKAKQDLNYKEPGEKKVVIVEPNTSDSQLTGEQNNNVNIGLNKSNPQKWWNYFFN